MSKLSAYFAVYSKTNAAVDAGFRALFGEIAPKGHPPVSVSGIFYDVADATQPDPAQPVAVQVFGQPPDAVRDTRVLGVVAGPILDRNGNPVADGTSVSFRLAKDDGTSSAATAPTVDGLAGAQLTAAGPGHYTATAAIGAIASAPLSVTVQGETVTAATAVPTIEEAPAPASRGDGSGVPLLAVAIGVPAALVLAAGGGGFALYLRRRVIRPEAAAPQARPRPEAAAMPPAESLAGPEPPSPPAELPALRIDPETRRVYVKGVEARPALSNEQFRLLLYLYERAGKVVGREELVTHVWPDAHAEGVSEEALDALVRRVRERIVQAGGERSYIVTLRGPGFRLEA